MSSPPLPSLLTHPQLSSALQDISPCSRLQRWGGGSVCEGQLTHSFEITAFLDARQIGAANTRRDKRVTITERKKERKWKSSQKMDWQCCPHWSHSQSTPLLKKMLVSLDCSRDRGEVGLVVRAWQSLAQLSGITCGRLQHITRMLTF